VVDDTYNANPASIKASAATLLSMAKGAKTALILGHMGELGTSSKALHKDLGHWIAARDFAYLFVVGEKSFFIADGAEEKAGSRLKIVRAASHEEAAQKIKELVPAGSFLLVKGSRSAQMEKVIAALMAQNG
jgi:UDP-N-acetylmuramoyl-tripeptide--D-alanyl-D-alanine ligase/murE/murF fusion protein